MAKSDNELIIMLHDKVDEVKDRIHSIDITVAQQQINLSDHMKRTALAEERLDTFEERVLPALDAYKFILLFCKISVPIATLVALYFKYYI